MGSYSFYVVRMCSSRTNTPYKEYYEVLLYIGDCEFWFEEESQKWLREEFSKRWRETDDEIIEIDKLKSFICTRYFTGCVTDQTPIRTTK